MYASHDLLGIVAMVQRKILSVGGRLAKKRGGDLLLSKPLSISLTTARRVHKRFERGDFTVTDMELGQIIETANWLAAQHAEMGGHPDPSIDWNLSALTSASPPPKLAFEEAIAKAIMEW